MSITVFTSIVGAKDGLREMNVKGDARFVAFTDFEIANSDWERGQAYSAFMSNRRNSRVPKLLAHQFVDTKYSIWIDGNLRLVKDPQWIVDTYLKDHDIAVFKHPVRDCIYDEAMECAKRGLDDPEKIIAQVKKYEEGGYGKHRGLAECMMIVRRHTPKVAQFNEAWFSEYCAHSQRDQISFMYALDKVGLAANIIDEHFQQQGENDWTRGGVVDIVPHRKLTTQFE